MPLLNLLLKNVNALSRPTGGEEENKTLVQHRELRIMPFLHLAIYLSLPSVELYRSETQGSCDSKPKLSPSNQLVKKNVKPLLSF